MSLMMVEREGTELLAADGRRRLGGEATARHNDPVHRTWGLVLAEELG